MSISVDAFIREYKVAAKQNDSVMEKFLSKHITESYINYITKVTYCDNIIKASCYVKDGDIEIIKINSSSRYLFFVMRLIDLYTDIDIDKENVSAEYDKLNEVGAINLLIASIPKNEYSEFSTLLEMRMDDFRDNEYSLTAFLYNIKQNLYISEEIINSVLKELQTQSEK